MTCSRRCSGKSGRGRRSWFERKRRKAAQALYEPGSHAIARLLASDIILGPWGPTQSPENQPRRDLQLHTRPHAAPSPAVLPSQSKKIERARFSGRRVARNGEAGGRGQVKSREGREKRGVVQDWAETVADLPSIRSWPARVDPSFANAAHQARRASRRTLGTMVMIIWCQLIPVLLRRSARGSASRPNTSRSLPNSSPSSSRPSPKP